MVPRVVAARPVRAVRPVPLDRLVLAVPLVHAASRVTLAHKAHVVRLVTRV